MLAILFPNVNPYKVLGGPKRLSYGVLDTFLCIANTYTTLSVRNVNLPVSNVLVVILVYFHLYSFLKKARKDAKKDKFIYHTLTFLHFSKEKMCEMYNFVAENAVLCRLFFSNLFYVIQLNLKRSHLSLVCD